MESEATQGRCPLWAHRSPAQWGAFEGGNINWTDALPDCLERFLLEAYLTFRKSRYKFSRPLVRSYMYFWIKGNQMMFQKKGIQTSKNTFHHESWTSWTSWTWTAVRQVGESDGAIAWTSKTFCFFCCFARSMWSSCSWFLTLVLGSNGMQQLRSFGRCSLWPAVGNGLCFGQQRGREIVFIPPEPRGHKLHLWPNWWQRWQEWQRRAPVSVSRRCH